MAKLKQPSRTLRPDAARALAADLGWHARLAARLVTADLDRGLAASGLSSAQFGLLCLIASAPDDTLGALALRAGLNQSTMSRNVDMLAGAGLVEIATVEKDRRRREIWLTEAGALRLQDALPLWRVSHRAVAEKLGPKLSRQFAEAVALLEGGETG
jgi:DNA-binding MarR family transcriptional regulator